MSNHFHLLVLLPQRVEVDEREVLRRYGVLKGRTAAEGVAESFSLWRQTGEDGEAKVIRWLDSQRRRMYAVGSFMKIVKQWFTEEYNRRNGHCGTLWEAAYHDRGVKYEVQTMAACLAYIHLNPVRAAAADSFDGYTWSSYAAFCRGDEVAVAGMRYVYGVECTYDEIRQRHGEFLESLLEKEKLRRAAEILRMRAAGYDVPLDPLTTEAFLQQAAKHFQEVRREALRLREARMSSESVGSRKTVLEREIVAALTLKPGADAKDLSEVLGLHVATIYRLLQAMAKKGLVTHREHGGFWCS